MAKEGLQPFCNIYSAFAQRAYDNIIHDVAVLNLPVVLCLDRAGLVGEDGATHHGAFDLAALRCIPNLTICSPLNERELVNLMYTAQLPDKGTFIIRYPRGRGEFPLASPEDKPVWEQPFEEIPVGKGRKLKEGKGTAVLSIGPVGNNVAEAVRDTEAAHYDLRFLKPLDETLLHELGQNFKHIITVEDGVRNGGMGSAVLEWMSDHDYHPHVVRLGLPDEFVEHGTVAELQHIVGLDAGNIRKTLSEINN
jgi:1-deoxy-D-xylulose-5-phosphate synthase